MPWEAHYPQTTPSVQPTVEARGPIQALRDPRELAPIFPPLPAPVVEAETTRPRRQPTPAQTRVPPAFVAYNRARQIQGWRWESRIAEIMPGVDQEAHGRYCVN